MEVFFIAFTRSILELTIFKFILDFINSHGQFWRVSCSSHVFRWRIFGIMLQSTLPPVLRCILVFSVLALWIQCYWNQFSWEKVLLHMSHIRGMFLDVLALWIQCYWNQFSWEKVLLHMSHFEACFQTFSRFDWLLSFLIWLQFSHLSWLFSFRGLFSI